MKLDLLFREALPDYEAEREYDETIDVLQSAIQLALNDVRRAEGNIKRLKEELPRVLKDPKQLDQVRRLLKYHLGQQFQGEKDLAEAKRRMQQFLHPTKLVLIDQKVLAYRFPEFFSSVDENLGY